MGLLVDDLGADMTNVQRLTEEGIDAMMPREVYRILDEFHVKGDDLSEDDAKTALKQKIHELGEEAEKSSPEQMMAEIAESYKAKRGLLLQRCQEIADYLHILDRSDKEKLKLHFGSDVMEILGEVEENLRKDDCPILVAGHKIGGMSGLEPRTLSSESRTLPLRHTTPLAVKGTLLTWARIRQKRNEVRNSPRDLKHTWIPSPGTSVLLKIRHRTKIAHSEPRRPARTKEKRADERDGTRGETSAGKSTLLNLLLGEEILPEAHLSSTSTICELKYGEVRRAVVHLRETDPETGPHEIHLSLGTYLEECRRQLEPYIHLRNKERKTLPKATKIEIFWPLAILKGGVTIVDSPGVGESDMMDGIIAGYIPSAFAFIYIIDSSRAGGVQEDRLGRLLAKCMDQGTRSELGQFDPTKAIFVCNKWDLVPEEERQEVKENTIQKLTEMWHGLDESRVFTHSNKEAVKYGFRSADFNRLLGGIYKLLPQSFNHKLDIQYSWMAEILEEALTFLRLKLNDAYRSLDAIEQRKAYEEGSARFEKSTAQTLEISRNVLEGAVTAAVTILDEILHGDELKKHLSRVPVKADTTEDTVKELTAETEVYLTSHEKFRDHVHAISQAFVAEYQEMVAKVSHDYDKNIRSATGLRFSGPDDRSSFTVKSKWYLKMLFRIIPIMMRLNRKVGRRILERYRSRLCDEAISTFGKDRLHSLATKSLALGWCFDLLETFESDLEAKKQLNRRLVEERLAETRSQQDLVSTYEPQASGITLQLGRLTMVKLAEMREFEFDLDNIIGWPDPQNRIAGGSYGEVYRVQVQRDGCPVRAAMKVGFPPYDITTEENAWDFITEEVNLRKLRGDHIVEYYGTACRKKEGVLRLGLVMELCEGTLESRIIGQKEHNPAHWGHDPRMKQRAFSYIQDMAIQLCEGLRTIHDAGYIHRDLKLTNILITAGDVVKLADVGVTKREVAVTGTITGTATYAAPEVKERKVCDKSADIYSLGLILWEMWYGQTMDDLYRSSRGLTEGETETRPGVMPQLSDSIRPIPEWEVLVQDCVNTEANRRPSALECLRRIRDMTM
ncbi:hypothetical protein Bbelb_305300 [Branchiostoma belcheri]|nr:hypothetical protein Bbelb_305300 [Branchiostoma belcheri]